MKCIPDVVIFCDHLQNSGLLARSPSCIFCTVHQSRWHIMNIGFFSKEAQASCLAGKQMGPSNFCFKKNFVTHSFGSGVKLSDNFLELGGESLLALRSGSCAKMVTSILRFLSRVIDSK